MSLKNLFKRHLLCEESADVKIEVPFELLIKGHRFSPMMRRLMYKPIDFKFNVGILFRVDTSIPNIYAVREKETAHRVQLSNAARTTEM